MFLICLHVILTIPIISTVSSLQVVEFPLRKFEIDYENDGFLKDGQTFRYISGSLHYFRVPRAYWRDRLRKYRAAGLNAISTYVDWSIHEPQPGVYNFVGENDLEEFIKEAQNEGLLVLLRPGPYICAERDLGGYPAWIFHNSPNIRLRTNDTDHTQFVESWMKVLMTKMQPLLYGNGGPIIMVQVENEYGSYWACDRNYTAWLRDLLQGYVKDDAVLYTTDGYSKGFLKCGPVPGVLATVDFGPVMNATRAFMPLREIQKHGPLVNSEFYPGHLTHWGDSGMSTEPIDKIVNTTRQLLQMNASFNYYMFHGGTNFGLSSGANGPPFKPQITSYDFDAPISESGNLTEKYFAIKSVISEFEEIMNYTFSSSYSSDYGTIIMQAKTSLLDSASGISYGMNVYPKTFEALGQYSGLVLYETVLPENGTGRGYLEAKNTHDLTIVLVNRTPVGILSRMDEIYTMILNSKPGHILGLLVENQGHINYGNLTDFKGITQNVTLDGTVLTNWNHTGYPLNDIRMIEDIAYVNNVSLPGFFSGILTIPGTEKPYGDTFIDMSGWGKGVVFVNGVLLGRYWPEKGPQVTLYLPATLLQQTNNITVLELHTRPESSTIGFSDTPIYSGSPVV